MPRFFTPKYNINENELVLTDEDSKHIKTVLRSSIGDKITVSNGLGKDFLCEIASLDKNVLCKILSEEDNETEPSFKVRLFQGLPKFDKMEFIIQKAVELGVFEIIPVNCERTVVKLSGKEEKKLDRWNKISLSAAKQSSRGIIPKICDFTSFKLAVSSLDKNDISIIAYENERDIGLKGILKGYKNQNINLFIGPEGGFSQNEINLALENNIIPITLGKRILRTETAGISALSAIMYELDWRE